MNNRLLVNLAGLGFMLTSLLILLQAGNLLGAKLVLLTLGINYAFEYAIGKDWVNESNHFLFVTTSYLISSLGLLSFLLAFIA